MFFLCEAVKPDVCTRAKRVSALSFAILEMRCNFTNATKLGACMSMCRQQTDPICQGVTYTNQDSGAQNCGICSNESSSALMTHADNGTKFYLYESEAFTLEALVHAAKSKYKKL